MAGGVRAEQTLSKVSPSRSLFMGSVRFAVLSGLVYGLALVKSMLIARYFGTTPAMDAYAIAVIVPNLLGGLIAATAASALVPTLAVAQQQGPEERANTLRAALWLAGLAGLFLTLLLYGLADPLTRLLAARFDAHRHGLAVHLLRLSSPILCLSSMYAFASAELLSRHKTSMVAVAPGISTLVAIVAVVLYERQGVAALVAGMVLGTLLQAMVVVVPAVQANPLKGRLRMWTDNVRRLLSGQGTLMAASAIGVTNNAVDQSMSAFLPAGNVAALNYGLGLQGLVAQVVSTAASWVALPEFSRLAAEKRLDLLRARLRRIATGLVAIALPVTIVVLASGDYLIRLVFEHGSFTAQSTSLVFRTWAGYVCGLVFVSAGMMAVRTVNALHTNRILATLGLVTIPLNALLDYVLMQRWGCLGISLSTSLVFGLTAVVLFRHLNKRIGRVFDATAWVSVGQALLWSAVAGAGLWMVRTLGTDSVLRLLAGYAVFGVILSIGYRISGLFQIGRRGVILLPRLALSDAGEGS
jgi:putative peptidoglycan lipid II flippase